MSCFNPFSLSGKSVLITGASSGIGRSMAVECSKAGAHVIITGRNEQRLLETLSLMDGEGHNYFVCDLNHTDEVKALIAFVPLLDGFISNAGCNKRMICQFIKDDNMDLVIKTNLVSPILLTKELLKNRKIKKGGSIVFTSSIAVNHSSIGDSVYSASKGGIQSFSRVLAMEVASKNIRVNTIQPGMVRTGLIQNSVLSEDEYEADEKKYPLKRYGSPDEIAWAAIYLLSDATVWMTGSSIVLDGGISLV